MNVISPNARFPPPWTVEALDGGFKIVDSNGQALAYVYGRADQRDAEIAKSLTLDEARRIAVNIAKLPDLLGKVRPDDNIQAMGNLSDELMRPKIPRPRASHSEQHRQAAALARQSGMRSVSAGAFFVVSFCLRHQTPQIHDRSRKASLGAQCARGWRQITKLRS